MKANCNEWLTFRDEQHTLAHVYESLRRVTTTNESTRIVTHLNFLSSFKYLIMFSSSSFHIKSSRRHIKFIRYSLIKMRPRSPSATNYHQSAPESSILASIINSRLSSEKKIIKPSKNQKACQLWFLISAIFFSIISPAIVDSDYKFVCFLDFLQVLF